MNHDRVEIFREKLDNFTISDYHGLISPGLTCYLNSVLQVFFMTEDFRGSIKRCCSEDSATIDTVLRKLFDDLERSLAETQNIIQMLGITDVYEQHDAAEYFEKILCLTSPEAAKVFKGELSHKTKCAECKKENNFRSSFWILPLAMENSYRQTYSLKRGLEAFFNKEKVCGENKMFCNQCKKKQDADIDCEMTQNPEILTLLLKRFTFDYKWDCYIKLHCEVDVPQTLHIENCEYDLYALVHHFGNLSGGHYTAEIKSFETGEWYHFNDDTVDRVRQPLFRSGNTSAKSRTAYLLMYRRVSTHPEKTDEISEEAQCSQVDEGGQDEAERGEAPVPRHQLKEERCPGDENLKHVNGDVLNEMTDDTDSEELETQPDQTAACVTPQEDIQRQTNTGADGDSLQTQKLYFSKTQTSGHHEPNRHHLNTNSEQINSQKQSLITGQYRTGQHCCNEQKKNKTHD
ncbi:ubiquitin carboxyl-terminal hydrolase 47 isoform X1 [Lates calcarifer]|uniref:Ubiquitin carboxyl-terminal hydrolase 47 isoform X1 n=1 Tax=Lates calcarifer TaxID=8187 RepID=A0AAJ7VL44_LATCA|nr:ubiquitin carboxyl-terminal hydrolase 47 isoform X1 [Lates calcarifer]